MLLSCRYSNRCAFLSPITQCYSLSWLLGHCCYDSRPTVTWLRAYFSFYAAWLLQHGIPFFKIKTAAELVDDDAFKSEVVKSPYFAPFLRESFFSPCSAVFFSCASSLLRGHYYLFTYHNVFGTWTTCALIMAPIHSGKKVYRAFFEGRVNTAALPNQLLGLSDSPISC